MSLQRLRLFPDFHNKEPGTGPSWSDLLVDILLTILQHLELPQAIAFASVCKTWRSAATVARVPCSCTPWIISWANHLEKRRVQGKCSTFVTCSSYHLDVEKAYDISFPQGCFVACCGASHGWLVLVNELSNLVLYNPFTTAMIPLPPITDFECVEAVYGSGGQDKWQVASTFPGRLADRYLDCAYHDGSFYTVTSYGLLEKWHLDELGGPRREELVSATARGFILTRHMVSTPWGDLLQGATLLRTPGSRCLLSHPPPPPRTEEHHGGAALLLHTPPRMTKRASVRSLLAASSGRLGGAPPTRDPGVDRWSSFPSASLADLCGAPSSRRPDAARRRHALYRPA
ncbi:hypothetical protein PR202_gb14659 [Eleusine coracana subsp. coracana]|uniref:F-box domain-containing protein n=1 Tax=Eleusine coracana subsp. coracana TaxID=191504 RepID=A0AAV5EVL4_ELECO|nr:hypothetical protein PR202_gb14659 [Eleusine coracana subsp. coracana]